MTTFLVKYKTANSPMPRYKTLTIDTPYTLRNQDRCADQNKAILHDIERALNDGANVYTVLAIGNFSMNDTAGGINGYAMMAIRPHEKITTTIVREPSNKWEEE